MTYRGQHFIQGCWQTGQGTVFSSLNPCKNSLIWQGSSADAATVDHAVSAARQALFAWSNLPDTERIDYLERFKQQLSRQKAVLSQAISSETGKPLWEAETEVDAMIGKIAISITAHAERTTEKKQAVANGVSAIRYKAHGVMAVFGPYNFPGHLPNGHIVPALLAGNTVVFKPSELTPLVAEKTVDCWQKAGLPAGVLNLVQGEKVTGIALAQHQGIDGLLFTGSSNTGLILHRQFAGDVSKMLALEMGGNNPLIVTDKVKPEAAIYNIIQSAYISAGQRCTCARRLLLPRSTFADQLLEKLKQAIQQLVVACPDNQPTPFMGPVISNAAADALLAASDRLVAAGAAILLPLQRLHDGIPLLTPGLLDVTAVADLPDEEYFGPLLQLIRYDDLDSAIQLANQTRYGLAAGIFTEDRREWELFYRHARAGITNWNRPLTGASSQAPFGGIGASGNHRPSAYFAADYCAYPVASLEAETLELPEKLLPGVRL